MSPVGLVVVQEAWCFWLLQPKSDTRVGMEGWLLGRTISQNTCSGHRVCRRVLDLKLWSMPRAQGGGEECGRKPQLVFLCGKEICLEASVYCLTSVFSLKQTQNGERIIIPCGPTWPASAPSSREAVTAGSWLPCSCSPSSTCSCETVNVSYQSSSHGALDCRKLPLAYLDWKEIIIKKIHKMWNGDSVTVSHRLDFHSTASV